MKLRCRFNLVTQVKLCYQRVMIVMWNFCLAFTVTFSKVTQR